MRKTGWVKRSDKIFLSKSIKSIRLRRCDGKIRNYGGASRGREGKNDRAHGRVFLDRFPPKPILQDDLHGLEGASFCSLDPHIPNCELPRKILKLLRAKGDQTGVDLFANFQKHHFRPLVGSSTSSRLDHWRYTTLSEPLGWHSQKNFMSFRNLCKGPFRRWGYGWLMGSKLLLGFTTHSETG